MAKRLARVIRPVKRSKRASKAKKNRPGYDVSWRDTGERHEGKTSQNARFN